MKNIIVIGGLSAGPSAAAKARRENEQANILLFEKGAHISYATCGMPYAFSGVIESREKLMVVKPELLTNRFNIDVHLNEEIVKIDTQNKMVYSNIKSYEYDTLIFATGASSIVPPIENIKLATNWSTCRSMVDFDKIINEGLTGASKNIAVIGAGLIGVEVAENLKEAGKKVTLIEGSTHVLNMWQKKFGNFAGNVLKADGINVLTETLVSKFDIDENGKIQAIITKDGRSIPTDFVILSVGIKPNTSLLLAEGAESICNGALKVNEFMETSIKDVYAAGDNVSIKNLQTNEYDYFPLGTHSNKAGRAAGANAVGRSIEFKGAYKTAIVKVFDYTLARTGMNATALTQKGIPFETVLTVAGSTPSYYPDQKDLITEIYYDPKTEEIYGAELFGEVGVDKRIDVLSTAIYAKLKMSDLAQLDLAYAPPFSPAKDPVVVTSYVTENILNDRSEQISVEALETLINLSSKDDYLLLDARTLEEFEKGTIPGAVNFPLDSLRNHIDFIKSQDKKVIVFCQKGLRGYLAELILRNNNITNVLNLAGGFKIWQMYSDQIEIPEQTVLS
ncbi:NADPH-dependent 2,4-dienoyl-CoA reductase/sulfur reductase-like enzyme [Mariniflexile fucanivorans]|uniref:NADPH-dependent 2,4-dienoyl-CoA reductase/sulfur reductase-like enzyme n=1 Tax=Mariniflexile fucanivorans TaxID=264023 RepID=A0A4V2QEP8_9FLAO|nr:FAD-dependent oxidoreductase [Mariniflexile fucanivorans]TCL68877.1 NADPH-dependent 2,4-dienoyl-CoA reductase/sulfur reductase-like enzyme [Mariniflexile fucanivorans]